MKTRKKYSKEFKLDTINLVLEQEYTRAQAARSLEVNLSLMARWIRAYQADDVDQAFRGNGNLTAEKAETLRLKEENKHLKMKKNVLKKDTFFFAKEQN